MYDKHIIDYTVFGNSEIFKFTEDVKHAISKGWQPIGGMMFDGEQYLQALVKYDSHAIDQIDFIAGEIHDINHKVPST